jgi:hypothetical protein
MVSAADSGRAAIYIELDLSQKVNCSAMPAILRLKALQALPIYNPLFGCAEKILG